MNRPEPTHAVIMEARALNGDVDAWIESLQLATLEHERVQVGNRAYAYAMKVSKTFLSGVVHVVFVYHGMADADDP